MGSSTRRFEYPDSAGCSNAFGSDDGLPGFDHVQLSNQEEDCLCGSPTDLSDHSTHKCETALQTFSVSQSKFTDSLHPKLCPFGTDRTGQRIHRSDSGIQSRP